MKNYLFMQLKLLRHFESDSKSNPSKVVLTDTTSQNHFWRNHLVKSTFNQLHWAKVVLTVILVISTID